MQRGADNVLLLRLFAAVLVVLGHSYVLCGGSAADHDPIHHLLPRTHSHLVGVAMFFTLSGFLISKAWAQRRSTSQYLRNRLLRIFPALAFALLGTAFVVGPLATTIDLESYFTHRAGPLPYVLSNLALVAPQHTLPSVFDANPVPSFVNGSLWTIRYELALYLLVALLGSLRMGTLGFALLGCTALAVLVAARAPLVHLFGDTFLAGQLAGCFLLGAIAYSLRRHVRLSTPILLAAALISLLFRDSILSWLVVLYFVFWAAYVPKLPAIPRGNDLSYGIYLWAFPLQQAALALFPGAITPVFLFACTLPAAAMMACVSWIVVEKPALRLKHANGITHPVALTRPPAPMSPPDPGIGETTGGTRV